MTYTAKKTLAALIAEIRAGRNVGLPFAPANNITE